MIDRIIDIAENAAYLRFENKRLVIEPRGANVVAIPIEDIGILLLSHGAATITQAALSELTQAGAAVVVCNRKQMPAGMVLPFAGHYLHSERLRAQLESGEALKKRLWQQIVREKIKQQSALLQSLHGQAIGFDHFLPKVHSGDPSNIEGQVANRYWKLLFPFKTGFVRDCDGDGINALLNYGYAILRAMTARAICAAGLHPACGLHHKNRYNAFCLADDLMEPFRPIVDRAVASIVEIEDEPSLKKPQKEMLSQALLGSVSLAGRKTQVNSALRLLCQSLVDVFTGKSQKLLLPDIPHKAAKDERFHSDSLGD